MMTPNELLLFESLLSEGIDIFEISHKYEASAFNLLKDAYGCDFAEISNKQLRRHFSSGKYRISELGLEKSCSRCHEYFPLTDSFWHSCFNQGIKKPISHCKACEHSRKARQRKNARSAN